MHLSVLFVPSAVKLMSVSVRKKPLSTQSSRHRPVIAAATTPPPASPPPPPSPPQAASDTADKSCATCGGEKSVPCTNCNAVGFLKIDEEVMWRTCHVCIGHGKLVCPTCQPPDARLPDPYASEP